LGIENEFMELGLEIQGGWRGRVTLFLSASRGFHASAF
jgi:hypothetical protein